MDNDAEAHPKIKRRKLHRDSPAIRIASASDLHHLLTSQRNSPSEVKTALHEFKEFLNATTQSENSEDRVEKLQILRVYSEEQLPSDQQAACFPDLISLWASAVENNNESILSSMPFLFSILLEIFSKRLEFREIGLSLCKSLLLKDQLRLLDRGLTATKTKEHLISPCLQLLTEVVSFDGGEVASLVYSKRDTTFKRLEVFLDQRVQSAEGSERARQKPTLRHTAQCYVLANLKFQSTSVKGDIVAQGKILRACLQNLKNDRAGVIRDILVSLEYDIVKASSLTKGIKSRLFNSSNLSSLATLYTLHEAGNEASSGRSIREQVDVLLRLVCTQQENGILQPQNGWYPAGSNPDQTLAAAADPNRIDLTRAPIFSPNYREKFPIKNGVLSTFILTLRPERDELQASLLRDIFRAAPELVADYFSRKSNFIAEPKDTPEWLGQSAFLFSGIQLPVPAYCGWKDGYASLPPPTSTVIESILPRPLDLPNTTRCLNLNHEVITLFAVRAVTVAFQKLRKVLEVYHDAQSNPESWKQASSDLLSAFSQRCPLAKDVISTFQRTPKSDEQLFGSIIELLMNYYRTLPHLMLLEKFDTSLALVNAIKLVGNDVDDQSRKNSRFSELENLLKIAQMSPDTKWWAKPDSLHYSAFTSILKAVLEADESISAIPSIKHLLRKIAAEDGVLVQGSGPFDALVTSLTTEDDWTPSAKSISFFDNCASRIARQPVHYEDLAAETNAGDGAICLLPFCIAEQWPFVTGAEDLDNQKNIAEWIIRLLVLLTHAGEDREVIHELHSQIVNGTKDPALKRSLRKAYQKRLKETVAQLQPKDLGGIADKVKFPSVIGAFNARAVSAATFEPQPKVMESMEGLERLLYEDVEAVVANGRLGRLCSSLSSFVEETRRQGFMTLQGMMTRIEHSSYSEKGPLFVLIGELAETAKSVGLAGPLASVLSEFAGEAVDILNQPSHPIYGKINKFLQKGPSWNVAKFVPYWAENTFLRGPEDDTGHPHETTWLLSLLIRGLRNNQDMELYRRSNVFDRVLALYGSTLCSGTHRRQILELVHRSIEVGGGLMLITRMGIENWLAVERADGKDQDMVNELENQLHGCIDSSVAQHWKIPTTPSIDVS